jgi:hypothetical protein
MIDAIEHFTDWDNVAVNGARLAPAGKPDFAQVAISGDLDAFAFVKVAVPNGNPIRAVARVTLRMLGRAGTRRGSAFTVRVSSSSRFVAENRRTADGFAIGSVLHGHIF